MKEQSKNIPSGGGKISDYVFCPFAFKCKNAKDSPEKEKCNNCKEQKSCCRYVFPAYICSQQNPCEFIDKYITSQNWIAQSLEHLNKEQKEQLRRKIDRGEAECYITESESGGVMYFTFRCNHCQNEIMLKANGINDAINMYRTQVSKKGICKNCGTQIM